jgi:hypothetical protein
MGLDTKTYWLTDRHSQCDFDLKTKAVTEFSWWQLREIVAAEARDQSELGLGVQKGTGGQPVRIWRLYVWYSAVVLGVYDLGRLL